MLGQLKQSDAIFVKRYCDTYIDYCRLLSWIRHWTFPSISWCIHSLISSIIWLSNVNKNKVITHKMLDRFQTLLELKILFITRVINIQILKTTYFSFQYSVFYSVSHFIRFAIMLLCKLQKHAITFALHGLLKRRNVKAYSLYVSPAMVQKYIRGLKANSSAGPDGLPAEFLKAHQDLLCFHYQ